MKGNNKVSSVVCFEKLVKLFRTRLTISHAPICMCSTQEFRWFLIIEVTGRGCMVHMSTSFFQQPVKSQNGPAPMSRSDSGSTFSTTSMPIGSSRGPSPLTIGMSDTIPLAVAFTDTIHAFFKGTDATR